MCKSFARTGLFPSNELATNKLKLMPGTVFKWTVHPEQLDDPPLAEQLDDPPFPEHLDDPIYAEHLDIIRDRKIYVGEKLFNFYWCLG